MDTMALHRVLKMCAKMTMESPNLMYCMPKANAITKIARSNNSSNGATMYVTASPCIECAKLIIQAGIKRVVYSEKYRLEDGLELLKRANIEVIYIDPNE